MSFSLDMEFEFRTSVAKLWAALTDSSKLAMWIADNDFEPVVGHRFQFRHEPNAYWDGVVNSEVIAIDEPRSLSLAWAVGEERHHVTLSIHDLGDGKVALRLAQTGFSSAQAHGGAKYGWMAWIEKLAKVLEK